MSDKMMLAVRSHAYGLPEQLAVDRVPRPEPQVEEVLVRVHAAGVNQFDWKVRKGLLKDFMPVPLPHTPGLDLAGIVEDVGPGVTTWQKGQAVYGRGRAAYAEYAIVSAGELAPKPRNLTFDQAASIPTGAAAAWVGIFDVPMIRDRIMA